MKLYKIIWAYTTAEHASRAYIVAFLCPHQLKVKIALLKNSWSETLHPLKMNFVALSNIYTLNIVV
jgi:hypothetical protein